MTATASAPTLTINLQTARRAAIAALVLLLFLEVFISRVGGVPARAVLDVTVVFAAALIGAEAFVRQRISPLHLILFINIALFTFLSLLGALQDSVFASLVSAVIFSKFLIVLFLAPSLRLQDLRPAMYALATFHFIGSAANLIFPAFFHAYLPDVSHQIDTSRLMGFSFNANRAATVSTVLLLYFLFIQRRLALVALFFGMVVLSGSRSLTLIASLIAGFLILQSQISYTKRLLGSVAAALIGGLLLTYMLVSDDMVQTITNTLYGELRYIRAAMLAGGYYLANEFFPLGVGGGQFGSSLSAGSDAYRMVGIAHWSTVINMSGVYDSGIGAILGEYGWLGLGLYIVIVFFAFRHAHRSAVPFIYAAFFCALVLTMSLFRTVASDFFYSFFFLFCYVLALERRAMILDRRQQDVNRTTS